MFVKVLLLVSCVLSLTSSVFSHGGHDHHHHDHDHDHSHDHGSGEKAVNVLTQSDFHSSVTENPLTLVEFFAPWCGHCKQLAPHYESAAERLRDDHQSSARLASVDCTVEKDLCSEFGIKGFPTIKLFTPSTVAAPVDYKGGRTADDIVTFMVKQSAPAYSELSSAEDAKKFFSHDGIKIVGIFDDLNDENAKLFKEAAQSLRNDYFFGLTSDPKLSHHSESLTSPSISIIKPNEPVITFEQSPPYTGQSIINFINSEAFPIFGEIGPENYQKFIDRGLPLTWVFVDPKSEDLVDHTNFITEAAKAVKGKLSVVKLDGVKWAEHMKHFGLPQGLPGIVIEDREASRNFHFPASSSLSASSLTKFFESFLDKSLAPNVKTEVEPADNNGPVKVIVGSSFDNEVINNDRDVFVEFYAPWCGHCKSLAPKWEELGTIFTDNENVVIGKVDATANDTPAKVQGFPTLILYPAGGKASPVTYEGDRTPQAMAEFVRSNGGTFKDGGHSEL